MSRRRVIVKRPINADPVYGSELLAKFINHLMQRGKKSLAEKVVYRALALVETKYKCDPLDIFHKALDNIKPMVEVKSRRVGGATYQVPIEVNADRAEALAMRWLVKYARERGEKGMTFRLAGEISDAADQEGGGQGKGGAVKKKEDTHRMAEANKAFATYRW